MRPSAPDCAGRATSSPYRVSSFIFQAVISFVDFASPVSSGTIFSAAVITAGSRAACKKMMPAASIESRSPYRAFSTAPSSMNFCRMARVRRQSSSLRDTLSPIFITSPSFRAFSHIKHSRRIVGRQARCDSSRAPTIPPPSSGYL